MGRCSRLEDAPRGVSRHPVVFVNYSGTLYAIKELPLKAAEQEYDALIQAEAQEFAGRAGDLGTDRTRQPMGPAG